MIIQDIKPVETLFKQFCEHYTARCLDEVLRLCSKNMTLWGTGLDEYRVGIQAIEEQLYRDWSQSTRSTMDWVSFIPTPHSAFWVAGLCNAHLTIEDQDYSFDNLRVTIATIEEQGKLKIAHMHGSFPDLRNPAGNSFPVHV